MNKIQIMKIRISKTAIISIFVLAMIGIFIAVIFFTQKKEVLIVEPTELNLEMNNSSQIRAYLLNLDSGEKEDVTNQAEWTTSNPDIVTVGNKSVKGYIITKNQKATAEIIAKYNDYELKIPVNVTRAKLSVECYPMLAEKWTTEGIKTAKVGDIIDWIGFYTEIGSPHYDYKWTGTDGLDGNSAIETKIYDTPGLKEVHFWTKDTAGTIAETDCSILIVK